MGNAHIAPRERRNPVSVSEASSSQGERASEMTRTHSVHANVNELESTQNETAMYLPKGMNRSSNGVIMPSKPYGCGGASTMGGIESPQWGWYISITPPASEKHHCGSRPLHKKQDSSANAPQASTRYLPKGGHRSINGVIVPSKPYGCGGHSTAGGSIDMYHSGSTRPLYKKQDSSTNASDALPGTAASKSLTATSHQPNRIFKDMQKGASMGWSNVPL
jgi:hypothetical protein